MKLLSSASLAYCPVTPHFRQHCATEYSLFVYLCKYMRACARQFHTVFWVLGNVILLLGILNIFQAIWLQNFLNGENI